MASYGRGYQDDWRKPITTVSDYPDHVCRPVIVQHGVEGYMMRAQRVVEVRHSYEIPMNDLLDEYNVHEKRDDDSPRKVNDFFSKVHNEASRPTLLSPPKLITTKPSWRSEDDDSPKYIEHRDYSGSPLGNKFEGLHLQDNRGSSPYKYKNDGYAYSMDSPKAGHVKDYGINKTWDSPPRSTHEDWGSRRDHDDYGKPKFNGGYKTSPPLSQATNDIGTAMKILREGNKPLPSSTYAPQSHFPASYSIPNVKESYPERTQGGKPLASPVSTQPSYYPTSNPITERKESYSEPTKGTKPLFSPGHTQPHSPTSNLTPQRKVSYPEADQRAKPLLSPVHTQPHSPTSNPTAHRKASYPEAAQGAKPLFSPAHTQQPYSPTSNSIPKMKENYPETTHGAKPLFSSGYTPQSHSPTSNLIPQKNESYPETTHGTKPLFSPGYTPQSHSTTSNPIPQRKESYPETAHGAKPLFSPGYMPQSNSATSNPSPQKKETYPETAYDTNPMFSPVSTQQSHISTSNPTSQNKETYPKKTKGWTSLFSPSAKRQPPTSHSTPELKQSYPNHETQDWKPSFSPSSSPEKERYSPQIEHHYPDQIQRGESFPSAYENTQEPRYGATAPPKVTLDSNEARKRYANLQPAQMKYSGTIDSKEAVKKYNGAFVP